MKKGLILTNAYSDLKSALFQSERLKEEFSLLGVTADVRRNDFFPVTVEGGNLVSSLEKYDFCIYLDKDKYVSQMLENVGLRLFNSHRAIELCDDKMLTAIALADKGINMPDTLPGLLCYDPEKGVNTAALLKVEEKLGFPVVVKKCHGSLGKEVYKADDMAALIRIAEAVKCDQHLFQKFIASSSGKDIRVIVVGGKVAASMLRVSDGDFRSNLAVGGHGEKISLSPELIKTCEKVAKILALDYCGIDVLIGEKGEYYVCEVNSNAFFGGIEKVTGVNVAKTYARHVFDKVYG